MVDKRKWLGILAMVLIFGMTVAGCGEEEEKSFKISITIKNISSDKTIDGYLFSAYKYDSWDRIHTTETISIVPDETSVALGPFTVFMSARGGRDFDFYISVIDGNKNINGTHDATYTFSEGEESPPSSITLIYDGSSWLVTE